MEVLLQDCTEGPPARAHATKLYGDFLLSLQPYPGDDDDDDDDGCCFFFPTETQISLFKYYHHSLIKLSHSLRLRPLLLHTHATRSSFLSQPTKRKFPSPIHRGKFSLSASTPLATLLLFFKFSNLPPGGGKSRDRGSGGGNFILEKIFTSPHLHLTTYYSPYIHFINIYSSQHNYIMKA